MGVQAQEVDVAAVGARPSGARLWLLPPFTAIIYLIHPALMLVHPGAMLQDPGTGWHLTTGRYILETFSIPTTDLYSYTAAGREWINYYWLFEAIGAVAERLGGIPLYTTVCMLLYAFIPVALFRRMLRMRVGLAPALLMTLAAHAILMSHALARPHTVTYLLFALLLDRLDRVQRGELGVRSLWWIPPATAVWCNMHGGFMAGLALAGIFAGVAALRWVLFREADEARRTLVFGGLLTVMLLATLLNPQGLRLHLSILEHLRMESIWSFQEFASPNFISGGGAVAVFERIVLALVLLLARRERRIAWVECGLLAFFLDQALHSLRHINLFAIVAAPIIAREVSIILDEWMPRVQRRLAVMAVRQERLRGYPLWVAVVWLALGGLAIGGRSPIPTTLDGQQLSRGAAEFIAGHEDRFDRMFNTDNVGGSLIYRFWPRLRVFVDDRIFVYGDDFVMNKYLPVRLARREWADVLHEYGVTAAVVAAKTSCATVFRASSGWELGYEDDLNAIFFKKG